MKPIYPMPFPVRTPKGIIVDERCRCGAYRTEHNTSPAGAPGHGRLDRTKCLKFTWTNHVYEGEK